MGKKKHKDEAAGIVTREDLRKLVDEADDAADKILFCAVAVGDMGLGNYADSVSAGVYEILAEASDTVRKLSNATIEYVRGYKI